MHELEQLVDDRLQKLPMSFEEPRVLSNDIHDVGRHDSFVVFTALHLCETKQILNDCDEETLFRLLVHGERNRADGPAENVAIMPRPLCAIYLL